MQKKIHVKIGEKVKVISGSHKGQIGRIRKIIRKTNRIIIEGINLRVKHNKSQGRGQVGEITEFEAPVHSSNVLPYKEE